MDLLLVLAAFVVPFTYPSFEDFLNTVACACGWRACSRCLDQNSLPTGLSQDLDSNGCPAYTHGSAEPAGRLGR